MEKFVQSKMGYLATVVLPYLPSISGRTVMSKLNQGLIRVYNACHSIISFQTLLNVVKWASSRLSIVSSEGVPVFKINTVIFFAILLY